MAECIASGNQLVGASQYTHSARAVLRRFVKKIEVDPLSCAAELRRMLEVLCAVEFGKNTTKDDGLLGAWIITRGLQLACTLAQRNARLPRIVGEDAGAPAHDLDDEVRLIEHSTGIARCLCIWRHSYRVQSRPSI